MADSVADQHPPETVEASTPAAPEASASASAETGGPAQEAPATAVPAEDEPAAKPAAGASATSIEVEYPDEEPEAAPEPEPEAEAEGAWQALSNRYGTAALSRLLKEQPELAQAAEASPRAKAQLYQMARRSQELGKYQEVFPSLGRAQEAVTQAQALENLDRSYFGGEPQTFWQSLYDAQVTRDPLTGQMRSSGAYERNIQYLHQLFLERVEQQAARSGSNDLSGAVQVIRDTLGWGHSRFTPGSQAKEGPSAADEHAARLPPHIRQKLERGEEAARELEQLRLRRSEDERQASERFMDETAQEAARELRGFVDGLLANAKLSDYDKANIARDFLEEVSRAADQDHVHNAALDELLRGGGSTPATRVQMVARVKAWARQNGRDILEPILQRAGAGLKQRQVQREAAQARHRSEPAVIGAPSPPRPLSARDLVTNAETKLGRRLTDREILELA